MGDPKADGAKPLMKPDPKDATKMVNLTDPTEGKDGEMGRGTVSYKVDPAMLPAMFNVVVPSGQSGSELYDASGTLTHTHTGLEHPSINSMEMNDLGPVYLKWSTQALSVGVYRETDDEPGWTNYQSKVDGGDQRPSAAVSADMQVELMVENSRGRLTRYEYKRFDSKGARTIDVANPMPFGKTGTAKFPNLPADKEFTVRFHAGSDRKAVVDAESDRNGRDVDTYGGDLDDGMSVGAFGDMAGAGSEVKLCPMSPSSADNCATFAYQWTSGSMSGKISRRSAGVASATVNLRAITDEHSPSENTKTSKAAATKGNYSFSSVQDGEYWVQTPATADNKADSMRVAFYHDEMNDDDADDGIIGNPVSHTWSPDVTALRLAIRGYVANDGQEGDNEDPDLDQLIRGDEAVAGIQLELLTITKVSANKKDTTFKVHATTETADDGSYAFDDVVEGSSYYVRATGSGIYVAAEASAKDGFSRKVAADEYPAIEEGDFALPYWNYDDGTTENTKVTVSNSTGTVSADFVNFALLYADGTISGRVREASGNPGNITIELIRCKTYEDGECANYDRTNFPTQTTETKSNGTWEFNDLLEGWYEIYVGEAGYLAANVNGGQIDDDASTESPEMLTGLVKGKRDLKAGRNFYVYDNGLDDDDDLGSDGVVIKGTTDPEEDPVELSDDDVITWASKNVTVTPDIDNDASFAVRTASRGTRPWPQSKGVATVEPDYNKTGSDDEGMVKATVITVSVTAENGYNDTDYTRTVYRAAPVGNDLAAGDFTVEAPSGATVRATSAGGVDAFTVNVANDVDELTFTVDLEDIEKQSVAVEMGGTSVDASDRKRGDRDNEVRFEVDLDAGANTIEVTVTSEDDVDQAYQLVVRRGADPTLSSDATLSTLSLSGVTLSPVFASGTMAYTAEVAHDAPNMTTVTATTSDNAARAVTSPTDADGNTAGHQVDISGASTRISVTVTAEAGNTETYTVAVTRMAVPATPTVTLGLTANQIDEDGGKSTVTATVSPASATAFEVTVSLNDDATATLSSNAVLSFAANATASTGEVVISAVDNDTDDGDETVTVSGALNQAGTDAGVMAPADVTLTITDDDGVPAMPTGLKVAHGDRTATVTWADPRPSQHGSSLITSYEVSAKAANLATVTKTVAFADRADGAEFAAGDLQAGITWNIEVVAKSPAGDSEAATTTATPLPEVTIASSAASLDESAVATTATLSASFTGAALSTDLMIDVSVDENEDDVELSAMRLTIAAGATETDASEATATKTDDPITITVVDDDLDEGNTARASLSDPVVATEIAYDVVKITGTYGSDNRATAPEDGVEIEITDDDAAPAVPASVTIDNVTASGFRINWTEPATANPAVTGYEYRVKEAGAAGDGTFADTDAWDSAGDADVARKTLTGLKAGTNYIVEVRAVNSVGEGDGTAATPVSGANAPDGTAHVKTSAS